MYYLYDYDTGEFLGEFTNKREKAGQVCYGQDTNSLLHNLAIGLYNYD